MSTTVRELLAEAERLTWEVVVGDRDPRALACAWPDFQNRATYAFEAIPETSFTGRTVQRQAIARAVRSAELDDDLTLRRALADPQVVRIGQLLGAATDLVCDASVSQSITGMSRSVDREAWLATVGEMTGQIARATREALEQARDIMPLAMNSMTGLWEVEEHSRALTATPSPAARDSVLHDAAAAHPRLDGDLREVLGAWVTQATWTLSNENPTPSVMDIRGATADLAILSAHTTRVLVAEARQKEMNPEQLDGLRDALNEAALGWRDVHQAWPNKIFGPRPATRGQHDASTALRRVLEEYTRPEGTWLEGPELLARIGHALPAVSAALREGTRSSYDIAAVYQLMPPAHVEAGRLIAPARALPGSVDTTEQVSLSEVERTRLDARKKGGWVPLATSDLLSVTEALDEQTKRTWTARATVRGSMHPPTSQAPVQSPAQSASAGLTHERKLVHPSGQTRHGPQW